MASIRQQHQPDRDPSSSGAGRRGLDHRAPSSGRRGRAEQPAAGNAAITAELSAERLAGTFPGNLGVQLTEITDEHVLGRMPIDTRQLHPMGEVHGGRGSRSPTPSPRGARSVTCRRGAASRRSR